MAVATFNLDCESFERFWKSTTIVKAKHLDIGEPNCQDAEKCLKGMMMAIILEISVILL